jgi:CrcB protein
MQLSPQPSFMTASLLVAAGGGVGSWLRYCAARAWTAAVGPVRASAFPWSTLTVNVAGSLAMGLLTGWLSRSGSPGEPARLLLAVGVLGGFTTFSSFSLETVALIQNGQADLALTYLAVSLAAGLIGLWFGLQMMRAAA